MLRCSYTAPDIQVPDKPQPPPVAPTSMASGATGGATGNALAGYPPTGVAGDALAATPSPQPPPPTADTVCHRLLAGAAAAAGLRTG